MLMLNDWREQIFERFTLHPSVKQGLKFLPDKFDLMLRTQN